MAEITIADAVAELRHAVVKASEYIAAYHRDLRWANSYFSDKIKGCVADIVNMPELRPLIPLDERQYWRVHSRDIKDPTNVLLSGYSDILCFVVLTDTRDHTKRIDVGFNITDILSGSPGLCLTHATPMTVVEGKAIYEGGNDE